MKYILAIFLFATSFAVTGCDNKNSQVDPKPATVQAAAPASVASDLHRFTSLGGSGTFALDTHTGLRCRTSQMEVSELAVGRDLPVCYDIVDYERRNAQLIGSQWRWNMFDAKWERR